MKIEHTIVPKKKFPLQVLASLGDEVTEVSWIFLHKSVVKRLMDTAAEIHWFKDGKFALCKFESEFNPMTEIMFECSNIHSITRVWAQVTRISAYYISFDRSPQDPKNIIFLKMED